MTTTPEATARVPAAAVHLIIACLEALQGRRALHQIRPRMEQEAFISLVGHRRTAGLDGARIGRLRLQMPHPGAVEATACLDLTGRWLACAVRLDHTPGCPWLCTDIRVVGLR